MLASDNDLNTITEQFGADATLRRSVATNRALINAMPDVLLRITSDGQVVNYKSSADDALLLPTDDWIGQPLHTLLGIEPTAQIATSIAQAIALGGTQVIEVQLTLQQHVRDYEVRLVATEPGEVLAILRDITDRLATERSTLATIATVAHELRTPLTAIRGALGLLLRGLGGDLSTTGRALITVANSNAGRVLRIISDLLDSEKAASGTMVLNRRPQNLMALVDEAIACNQTYAAQFDVRYVLTAALPQAMVYVDGDRLIQVLTNLLANAARFSPAGQQVEVSVTRHNEQIRINVRDRGAGIPESFRPRIFQKFSQAPAIDARTRSGTGLGLSISRAIVDQLDGQIGFETITGQGTTFYVDLPIWAGEALAVGTLTADR